MLFEIRRQSWIITFWLGGGEWVSPEVDNEPELDGGIVYYLLSKLDPFIAYYFQSAGKAEDSRGRGSTLSREGRKQLFAVLQSARGSPGMPHF